MKPGDLFVNRHLVILHIDGGNLLLINGKTPVIYLGSSCDDSKSKDYVLCGDTIGYTIRPNSWATMGRFDLVQEC